MSDPYAPWLPWPDPTVYTERSPENLLRAAEQFKVGEHVRYRPWLGRTYCNIFSWDVTRALGVEVPHWVYESGDPASPMGPGAREMSANDTQRWLTLHGGRFGWRFVETKDEAEMRADLGYPTLAVWYNTHGSGHISLMLPHGRIVQAGRKNGVMLFERGWGNIHPQFYTHD